MDWPFPPSHTRLPWQFTSSLVICASSLLIKTFQRLAVKIQTKNMNGLLNHIWNRPANTPLITYSNHASCVDDVGLWPLLPLTTLPFSRGQRWCPGAKEVVFTNPLFTYFFSKGKLVPVARGAGVYQESMDFLVGKLQDGGWVHIYPEGRIIADRSLSVRHKWGVGRLVAECSVPPIVLPIWHVGMDDILPNRRPYIPQLFQVAIIVDGQTTRILHLKTVDEIVGVSKLTVLYGDPVALPTLSQRHRENAVLARKQITEVLQDTLLGVRSEAEELHQSWNCSRFATRRNL